LSFGFGLYTCGAIIIPVTHKHFFAPILDACATIDQKSVFLDIQWTFLIQYHKKFP
jgi:hypothetical protein